MARYGPARCGDGLLAERAVLDQRAGHIAAAVPPSAAALLVRQALPRVGAERVFALRRPIDRPRARLLVRFGQIGLIACIDQHISSPAFTSPTRAGSASSLSALGRRPS